MDSALNEKCLAGFIELTHSLTGITIASNRSSMIEGRIRKRVAALELPSYESYLALVRKDANEQTRFIDLITTNETYFYRTPRIWDYVEKKLLPAWFEAHPKAVFTAWSAAASSGEEARTLGVICQAFKETHPSFAYQITGTDISREMIDLCRKGGYSGRSIDSFRKARPDLFGKYMRRSSDDSYEVAPEIQSRLKFHVHDLFRPLAIQERFDLVLIRNVLIYFTGPDQEKVISHIQTRMSEDGVMIIGESESLSHIRTEFKPLEPLIYRPSPPSANRAALKAG